MRAQLCLRAITDEMPQRNEMLCPRDFKSVATGKDQAPKKETVLSLRAGGMPFQRSRVNTGESSLSGSQEPFVAISYG
jgi:hypothetical protein